MPTLRSGCVISRPAVFPENRENNREKIFCLRRKSPNRRLDPRRSAGRVGRPSPASAPGRSPRSRPIAAFDRTGRRDIARMDSVATEAGNGRLHHARNRRRHRRGDPRGGRICRNLKTSTFRKHIDMASHPRRYPCPLSYRWSADLSRRIGGFQSRTLCAPWHRARKDDKRLRGGRGRAVVAQQQKKCALGGFVDEAELRRRFRRGALGGDGPTRPIRPFNGQRA
jgi:hypothetical protein